ncbi:alpha/beta hydrolase [Fusobacterium perfoetens]|uniref:alpha/beta hydrolase n=1 Tax=Fusobacterium perfoetens TaxID=852 RepID=UPI0026F36293|nr:DUF1749 domain-containing protein [Fusobacterium perfoetens]
MELLHRYTKDGLNLVGAYWEPKEKKACVVFTHGMFDNVIENNFIELIGENLSKEGYGFIFGHNRGYGVINSIIVRDPVTKKAGNKIIGSTYEKFGESIYDVDLWIETAKELGYKKIILASHSFGCLKNLYYLSKKGIEIIDGLILISAPDTAGLVGRREESKKMFLEAEQNIKAGNSKKIMEGKMLNIFPISSRTFYTFRKGSILDIFPLVEKPKSFGIFSDINKPILVILGEKDSVIGDTPEKDLEELKKRAIGTNDFSSKLIYGASHKYIKKERELSFTIVEWMKDRY